MAHDLMRSVVDEIEQTLEEILHVFNGVIENGGLTRDQYVRLLVQEYHREKGRHRHLFEAAAELEVACAALSVALEETEAAHETAEERREDRDPSAVISPQPLA